MINKGIELIRRYSFANWALADQGIVSAVNFITAVLLARFLGLEEFGRYSLAWIAVLITNAIQDATIIAPMMSIGPKRPDAERSAYFAAVIVQQAAFTIVTSGLIFAGVVASGLIFPEWNIDEFALPLAAAAAGYQMQSFLRRYFFTTGQAAEALVNDVIRYVGQVALIAALLPLGLMSVENALWAVAGSGFLATLIGARLVRPLRWDRTIIIEVARHHWHFAKWLLASALLSRASTDSLMIAAGALLGSAAVGALQAVQTLVGMTHVMFLALGNVVPVRLSWHFHHGGVSAMMAYVRRIMLFVSLVTGAVLAVGCAAPEFWLSLIYGDEYSGYGYLVWWFAVVYLLIAISLPLGPALRTLEQTREIFRANLVTAIISILAAYPLVWMFGLIGVLLGGVVLNFAGIAILSAALKRHVRAFSGNDPAAGVLSPLASGERGIDR